MNRNVVMIAAGLIVNLAAGFYNMGASVHDKTAMIISCLVYVLWVTALCIWIVDCRTVTIPSACRAGLDLAACCIGGIFLSQSFIGLLFVWPFIGIAYLFFDAFYIWITVMILYLIPAVLFFGAALWNERKQGC